MTLKNFDPNLFLSTVFVESGLWVVLPFSDVFTYEEKAEKWLHLHAIQRRMISDGVEVWFPPRVSSVSCHVDSYGKLKPKLICRNTLGLECGGDTNYQVRMKK